MSTISLDLLKYLPSKAIPALIGLISIPIYLNYLSQEQYGSYIIILTITSMISGLFSSWVGSVSLRYYFKYGYKKLHNYLKSFVIISIILGTSVWLMIYIFFDFDVNRDYFFIVPIWYFIFCLFEYKVIWFRAANKPALFGIALSLRSILSLLVIIAIFNNGHIEGKYIFYGQSIAMLIIVLLIYVLPNFQSDEHEDVKYLYRNDLLRYGIPIAISNFLIICLTLGDRFILNLILGPDSVAIYAASYDIPDKIVAFINSLILLSSSAIGYKIFEKDGATYALDYLHGLTKFYIVIVMPFVLVLAFMLPEILKIILPSSYASGFQISSIIAINGLIIGLTHRYSLIHSFNQRSDIVMWSSFFAILLTIPCCLLLTIKYGILGTAISSSIAYSLWFIFIRLSLINKATFNFPFSVLIKTIFIMCLIILFETYLFNLKFFNTSIDLILVFSISMLIYFLCAYFFGLLGHNISFKNSSK